MLFNDRLLGVLEPVLFHDAAVGLVLTFDMLFEIGNGNRPGRWGAKN